MRTLGVLAILAFVVLLAAGAWFYMGHTHAATGASPGSTATAATTPTSSTAAAASAEVALAKAPADGGAGSKPCSLITQGEMQAIVGASIRQVTARKAVCAYVTDETHEATVETTWSGGREAMADARKFNGETMRAVPGLGDEAYFQAAGVMHVRKGDVYLIVDSRVYPNDEATETSIVRKALTRLT